MRFVLLGTIRSHLSKEQRLAGMARRAEWKYPQGLKVVGEYWRSSAPELVVIFETDKPDPMMAIDLDWGDFFQMSISPALTPEEGLAIGKKAMGG